MTLHLLDWSFIFGFLLIALLVGIWSARRAGKNSAEFFLSGRHLPWWLLGMSMVATTFSTDTPNLVTDIVRTRGVAGNWCWWAFLLTGMLTVFVYARLWRRSGALTDNEFYELRYSGKPAAFLRGFRAIYLGLFLNVLIMATVSLAAIKIGKVMFDYSPLQSILVAASVTMVFSCLGGFRGVILTDFLLFIMAMVGAFAAAWFALGLPEVGGLSGLMKHPNVVDKLDLVPINFSGPQDWPLLIELMVIPLAVQWWAAWYPGSEPGGGGYIAQRMLAAKNERHAVGATLFFNVAHYALRPWPWIIVALCSLVVFPDLQSLQIEFATGDMPVDQVKNDLAYPAMLQKCLPTGWLGLVMASLIAAYMSTISTHLNWGSSYLVNDFYKRFLRPAANPKEQVLVGRLLTIVMMVLGGGLALFLSNAKEAFDIILGLGAGTGLVYLLRWFWWRVNAWSEISAMIAAGLAAIVLVVVSWPESVKLWRIPVIVAFTTLTWLIVTMLTKPTDNERLRSFCRLIKAGGPGWEKIRNQARAAGEPLPEDGIRWSVPIGLLCMFLACILVYATLFATGYFLYGKPIPGVIIGIVALLATISLVAVWPGAQKE